MGYRGAMKADGSPTAPSESEAAAQRRWLITIVITVLFGGFGAVMAYLSYANSSKPSASSTTGSSRASGASPSGGPPVAPPAAEPSSEGVSADPHKGKPDKDK